MNVYTAHYQPTAMQDGKRSDFVLVKEGFCWGAFVFGVLWALWHRAWWVALGLLIVGVALESLLLWWRPDGLVAFAASLGLAVLVGWTANDLRRWSLMRKGYVDKAVVMGVDRWDAERRFLQHAPDVVHTMVNQDINDNQLKTNT